MVNSNSKTFARVRRSLTTGNTPEKETAVTHATVWATKTAGTSATEWKPDTLGTPSTVSRDPTVVTTSVQGRLQQHDASDSTVDAPTSEGTPATTGEDRNWITKFKK
jgi:hypothetical protein